MPNKANKCTYIYILAYHIHNMATTIRISKEMLRELEKLKEEKMASSYEELIRKLIEEYKRLKKSHFGTLPKLEKFRREEIDRFD